MSTIQEKYKKLIFARQFFISEKKENAKILENFKYFRFDNLHIYVHSKCDTIYLENANRSILLFGYLLDSLSPIYNNEECLNNAFSNSKNIDELTEYTDRFCGRWVILYKDKTGIYAFNDATGLKQIFYATIKNKKYISSSENLIAEVCHIHVDTEVKEKFLKPMNNHIGWWWPGNKTPYKEISSLIPNFYLNFKTFKIKRFWPNKKISFVKPVSITFNNLDKLLKNIHASFFHRYKGNLALTGGIDSRLNLAYCKPYIDSLKCSTFYYESKNNNEDFEVPKIIARKFGLDYELYKTDTKPDKEFINFFNRNSSLKNSFFCNFNYTGYCNYPENYIYIGGILNEIVRSKYLYRPFNHKPKDIANLTYMGNNRFAVKAFDFWLNHALIAKEKFNTKTEDLFLIEQKLGRWNAMLKAESDFIHDTFEAFNSRNIMFLILSIPTKYKRKGFNDAYAFLYEKNWPELLSVKSSSLVKPKKKSLKIHLWEWLKWIQYLFK